jgi:hypothetical protein
MTDRELLQQALRYMDSVGKGDMYVEDWEIAEAIRTKLTQPEDKPNKLINVNGVLEQAGYVKKKEWVGLTDDEMFDCLVQADGEAKRLPFGFKWFAEAVEAKLKEKNT